MLLYTGELLGAGLNIKDIVEAGLCCCTSDDSIPSLPVAVEEEAKPTPDAAMVLRILLLLLLLPSRNNSVAKSLPGYVDGIPRPLFVVFLCPLVVAVLFALVVVVTGCFVFNGVQSSFSFVLSGDIPVGDGSDIFLGVRLLPIPFEDNLH